MPYTLTREQLLEDLHVAYIDARRHKRSKPYQQRFEAHAERNLEALCDELYSRTYRPRRRLMLSEPAFIKYGVFDICYRRYFCAF